MAATGTPGASRPLRIHLPWTAVLFPLLLAFCITPLATAGGGWVAWYAVPAAALVVVVSGGTTATSAHLSVRWLRGRIRIAWDQFDRVEFRGQRWAVAVTRSGRRVVLPGVRPVDLPRLVAAAGGRLFLRRPVAGGGAPAAAPAADPAAPPDAQPAPAAVPGG